MPAAVGGASPHRAACCRLVGLQTPLALQHFDHRDFNVSFSLLQVTALPDGNLPSCGLLGPYCPTFSGTIRRYDCLLFCATADPDGRKHPTFGTIAPQTREIITRSSGSPGPVVQWAKCVPVTYKSANPLIQRG